MSWLWFTPKLDHARVVAAISAAERLTSGEIQVLIARHRAPDPVAAAQRHFRRLGLANSPHRNSVLLFVAPRSRSFAVIGDQGIHERCGDAFWTELAAAMTAYFQRGEFTEGLVHGIARAGELLAVHFPRTAGDPPPPPPVAADVD
jgi:uncharacterized membrane protein